MRFKILGSSSGLPQIGKNLSSVWINFNNKNILIDCGDATAFRILENNLSKDFLDAIVISHYHPDHVAGIFMLLQTLYLQKRQKSLTLYLPERISDFKNTMKLFYLFDEKFPFKLNYKLVSEINSDFKEISIIETNHLSNYSGIIKKMRTSNKMLSYSFIIKEKHKSLLYTSDTNSLFEYENLKINPDIIILDGLHSSAESIFSFIKKNKRVILTHGLSDELRINIENNILETSIKNKLEMANETQIIEL